MSSAKKAKRGSSSPVSEDDSQTCFVQGWARKLESFRNLRKQLDESVALTQALMNGIPEITEKYEKIYERAERYNNKYQNFPEYLKNIISNHFVTLLTVLDDVEFLRTGRVINSRFKEHVDEALLHPSKENYFLSSASQSGPGIKLHIVSCEGIMFEQRFLSDDIKKREKALKVIVNSCHFVLNLFLTCGFIEVYRGTFTTKSEGNWMAS